MAIDVIEIFCSYSHKDEELKKELENHLSGMKRQGLITLWSDRQIDPATEWKEEIDSHLESAEVILLLVSADFIASDYCYEKEMMRAMQRHKKGETRTIPIILREVDWKEMPFSSLQALPKDGKAITSWRDRDKAFAEVTRGIRNVVEQLRGEQLKQVTPDTGYWNLTLQGTIDEINRPQVETILSTLRGYVGDSKLQLQRIETGSIVCDFVGQREGVEVIQAKINSGEMVEIAGLKIEGMGWGSNIEGLTKQNHAVQTERAPIFRQESRQPRKNGTMEDEPHSLPFSIRFLTAIGRPFGLRWVQDNHVRAIYRMESYFESRGPHFFWIDEWRERLGSTIYLGPRFRTFTFANLSTRDPLSVGLRVSASFSFDPRKTKREIAAQLVNLEDDVRALIVEGATLKSIRSIVTHCLFEEIRHGRVFESIEQRARAELSADSSLGQLGIEVVGVQVLEPVFSETIETRFDQTSQRKFRPQATQDFNPTDIARTLAIEIVEQLNTRGQGGQYLNTGDILNALQQLPDPSSTPTKMIDVEATRRSDFIESDSKV